MKLFHFPTSPYVRKVRVLASELGIELELIEINPLDLSDTFGKVNPINRVPALETEDAGILFDSRVISEYLAAKDPSGRFLPSSGSARWATLVLQALGDGIMDAAVPRRHESIRPTAQQSVARLHLYERSIRQTLDHLETIALPQTFDLGAISIASALLYLDFRFPDDGWRQGRPRLAAWLSAVECRPSVTRSQFLS